MIQATVMLDAVAAGAGHDPLLRPFLDSADDEKARHHLAELLERHASPLVRDVVRGQVPERLGGAADASDVHSGVLLRLTAHLWTLRASADAAPLESFSGYVAATAHNACHAFFRNRYPHRSRLRNKLRYVLTRGAGLALWSDDRQSWVAGLTAWSGRRAAPEAARRLAEARGRTAPRPFADLVRALVEQAGGPCRLEDLAEAAAHVLGVTDDALSLSEETETSAPLESRLADTRPSQGEQLESRLYLERLWSEILTLPPHQRTRAAAEPARPERKRHAGPAPPHRHRVARRDRARPSVSPRRGSSSCGRGCPWTTSGSRASWRSTGDRSSTSASAHGSGWPAACASMRKKIQGPW